MWLWKRIYSPQVFQFHLGCSLQPNPFMNLLQPKHVFHFTPQTTPLLPQPPTLKRKRETKQKKIVRFDMSITRLIRIFFIVTTQIQRMNANGFMCKQV
jgi:hypothetical protein